MIKIKRNFIFTLIGIVLALMFTVVTVYFSARVLFRKNTDIVLEQLSQAKFLEFDSQTNAEIKLAVQMAKSPVIVQYMKNPENEELSALARQEVAAFQESFAGKNSFWIAASDLKYYSDGKYLYTLDKTDPKNAWFDANLQTPEVYSFVISYDVGLKKTMLWIDAVVRDTDGTPLGLAGTGINLSSFTETMFENLDKDVTMFMYNKDLEITAAADSDTVEKKISVQAKLPELKGLDAFPSELALHSTARGEYILRPVPSVGWTLILF